MLEALFVIGRIGISRREGNRRYYDLIERLVPAELLAEREPEEVAMRHRLLSRYRAHRPDLRRRRNAEVVVGTGNAAERRRRDRRAGRARRADRRSRSRACAATRYVVAEERRVPARRPRPATLSRHPGVAFLAPLDPLVWDRRLLRDLFGFDYIWEVYVPEPKRRWGYYVLPILFGDRLVGRFEPRLDRATRTLRILGLWWEDGFNPRKEDGFVDAMRAALAAYLDFVGAEIGRLGARDRFGRPAVRSLACAGREGCPSAATERN